MKYTVIYEAHPNENVVAVRLAHVETDDLKKELKENKTFGSKNNGSVGPYNVVRFVFKGHLEEIPGVV